MNFKSEKGVTLTSLIIYVIAMLITVTIITVVTGYFTKNVDVSVESYTYFSEYTKVESAFTEEVNHDNNKILEVVQYDNNPSHQAYVAFSSGNQYTFVPNNQAIYQNNVKIASGVQRCQFTQSIENGKQAIKVELTIKGNAESDAKTRTSTYILKD